MIMVKIFKVCFCLFSGTLSAGGILAAQQPSGTTVPPAPVPAQILAAKKVFISNVPGELFYSPRSTEDDPYRPYNQFYASLKSWGYHELVSAPADADLILEVRLRGRRVAPNTMTPATTVHARYLELTVRDPKTQVVLWWLAERLPGANRVATGEKNYNLAMTNLVKDWKKLVGQPTATSDNYKK